MLGTIFTRLGTSPRYMPFQNPSTLTISFSVWMAPVGFVPSVIACRPDTLDVSHIPQQREATYCIFLRKTSKGCVKSRLIAPARPPQPSLRAANSISPISAPSTMKKCFTVVSDFKHQYLTVFISEKVERNVWRNSQCRCPTAATVISDITVD